MEPLIARALDGFVTAARDVFADDLRAVVLFGSAAEDRLRATSDVNLIVVLRRFEAARAVGFSSRWSPDWTAVRLAPMWLEADEIDGAARAFAVKFLDVRRRHRVLHGDDPFATLAVPRDAALTQVRQNALSLLLRLRHALIARAGFEDGLAAALADLSGPMRATAAELLELEGAPAASPKAALQAVAGDPLEVLSRLRDEAALPPGEAPRLATTMLALAERLAERTRALA